MEGSFYGAYQNMPITSMPFGPDSISSAGCHGGVGADTMNERSGNAMKNFNCAAWSTAIRIGRWSCLVTYRKGDVVDDPSLCADLGTSRTAHYAVAPSSSTSLEAPFLGAPRPMVYNADVSPSSGECSRSLPRICDLWSSY